MSLIFYYMDIEHYILESMLGVGNKKVDNIEILYVSGQALGQVARQGSLSRSSLTTLNKFFTNFCAVLGEFFPK